MSRSAWTWARCRTPHGVRGLKYHVLRLCAINAVSHPSRGAWIEITISGGSVARRGRTPHGVRGLKCGGGCPLGCLPCRTPHGVRGLKYAGMWVSDTDPRSHPSRGAWIEIARMRLSTLLGIRRTPHGVRGLKFSVCGCRATDFMSHPSRGAWIEICSGRTGRAASRVAPLTGCVD